jgi:EAL domain-containing protein (putative c-di-GMP-specific phosphodiesterase class I)
MLMWKIEGLPEMRVAINISSKQFKRSGFVGRVNSLIEESGIKPSLLEFEITESVLVEDVQQATQIMNELKKLGIRLSIDDFGTGYSSLSYLKKFPISTLKIDRSFINDVGKGKNGEAITDAIIAMGKALELNTIAEGVESSSQKKYLLDSGVNEVQGYYFSRPMTANNITKLYWRVEGDYERQILDFMPALQFC